MVAKWKNDIFVPAFMTPMRQVYVFRRSPSKQFGSPSDGIGSRKISVQGRTLLVEF